MKHLFLFLFSLILVYAATAQEWSEPVNVSNMNDFILKSDFTIDNAGVIHCVWNLKYNANYGVIYYARSEDDGFTWTVPISISQNQELYCTSPHIVHDSQNRLYVGYDLNDYSPQTWGSYACLVIMDGFGWGQPLTLSEGIHTRMAVDYNDRVYVFWFQGAPNNGEFCYQYLENGQWSQIFIPYDNFFELTVIWNIVVDNNNNLHGGGFYDPSGTSNAHPAYYEYNYALQQWNITMVSTGNSTSDIDIALDTAQLPHICFGGNATCHTSFNGESWSIPDTINFPDPYRVVIEVDMANKIHIATTEEFDDGIKLVYYHKPDGNNWVSEIVDQSTNTIFTPEFKIWNNSLYLVYKLGNQPGFSDVFIARLDELISVNDNYPINISYSHLQQNYPNPFSKNTNISFCLKKNSHVSIVINDIKGFQITTLIDKYLLSGEYTISWDGTNRQGNKISAGIYLYSLQTNGDILKKKILYLH